jgi:hypothetical protein
MEKIMKSINPFTKVLAVLALISTLAATTTFAQPLITVDELGNGTYNGNPLPSGLKADPFSGIVTLAYQLPFAGLPGDVLLFEPGPQTNVLSDIIRFDGHGFLYFFSEREPTDVPPFDPADVNQFPSPVPGLQSVSLQEIGPEGNNGASYFTAAALPGDDGTGTGVNYRFISDVPEPSAGLLTVLGGGLLLVLKRRQAKGN